MHVSTGLRRWLPRAVIEGLGGAASARSAMWKMSMALVAGPEALALVVIEDEPGLALVAGPEAVALVVIGRRPAGGGAGEVAS